AQVVKAYPTVTYPDAKDSTALMVVTFDKAIKVADIETAMQKLPDTTIPPVTSATPTPTAASGTPSTTASATGTASATATPTAAPTATATPSADAPKFPVSVTKVQLGENNQTYLVNTQTAINADRLNNLVYGLDKQFGPTFDQGIDTV